MPQPLTLAYRTWLSPKTWRSASKSWPLNEVSNPAMLGRFRINQALFGQPHERFRSICGNPQKNLVSFSLLNKEKNIKTFYTASKVIYCSA